MKRQLAKIQQIKAKIQTLMKLVGLGIKKYILALLDLEAALEAALKQQIKKSMKVQIKTGSEWHTTERRGSMVTVNGQPIYQVLKPSSHCWELVGNKGKHGKWCVAEYLIPTGAKIEFSATANGRDKIVHSFVVGEALSVDVEGYSYGNDICGWIVSI